MKTKFSIIIVMLFAFSTIVNASFPVKAKTVKTESSTTISSTSNDVTSITLDENARETTTMEELESPAAGGEGKSQVIALLLCALVGGLGIHRFYLGYTTIGIIQLLTLGGCGIWALIDLIRIITGDLKPKDGEYAKKL